MMEWKHHSEYRSYSIQRLYDGAQAKARYRCIVDGEELTAVNLAGIKSKVRDIVLMEAVA
ncbi:MAG: hypothetical protein PHF83_05340 [Candidatus Methanomethylophilus sp.]|jgi:hypothetical protein|nr:hypothetical protein [Methanomethylophilus sp.]